VKGDTKILIRGTITPTFTVYKLDRPARVVVDVSNAVMSPQIDRGDGEKATWQLNTWAVGNVSAHAVGSARGSVVRVVVGLARPGSYKVEAVGDDVHVTITPRDPRPADTSEAHRAEAKNAKRTAAAAKAEAARARAEAQSAAEQAAAAKAEAKQSKQRTAAAEAELEQLKKALAQTRSDARRKVEKARAAAAKTQRAAEQRAKESERQLAEASEKMKAADRQLAEAKRLEREAAKAKREAQAAAREASKREHAAEDAAKRASQRQAEAERATAAAKRYQKEAADLAADDSRLTAMRKRAEDAARDAEDRRAKAEAAARMAEMRKKEAETAAAAADSRRQDALKATSAAELERVEADRRRATAVRQRQDAEARQKEAQQRAEVAQASAEEAMAVAKRAKELRAEEEAAYRNATRAREQAESRQKEIEQATEKLDAALVAAQRAEAKAEERRARTEAARRDAEEHRRAGDAKASAKAAEVARLEKATAAAEAVLTARRGDVRKQKQIVAGLRGDVEKTAAELSKLKLAAQRAREARVKEEQQLEELAVQREAAEKELRRARLAREQAERAATEAEESARLAAERKAKAEKSATLAAERKAKAEKSARLAAERKAKAEKSSTQAKRKAAPSRKHPGARIRTVEFEDRSDVARVTLALSSPAKPRIVEKHRKKVVLEIDGATIPDELERTLDTTRYRGPIQAISSYRDPKHPSKVRVEVQLAQPTKSRLAKVGNIYHWDFQKATRKAASASAPQHASKQASRRKSTSASSSTTPIAGGYGSSSTPITQQTVAQLSRTNAKVYRGTKIDLDFKDADIHNLLRLLADVGGVNIVIPDEIKYRVTVRMRRVPWDQALEVILASKGLWYERNGNLYRIAPRKELDAEAQAEAERRAAMAKSEAPATDYITLNYTPAKDVQGQVSSMLSPKGSIQVDKRTNTIVISDVKANRNNILELLRRLDTPTPQIQIEARVVEARSSFAREVGIQWGGSATASGATGNSTGLVFPNSVALAGGADDSQASTEGLATLPPDFAVNMPAAVGAGSGGALGLSLGSVGGNFALSLRLSAMESEGTVRIVSAPKITVLNNEKAEISQGVSIPVSVVSANGVQTQFVPADLALRVTPTVSQADCAVTLVLEITKNEADFGNTGARGDPSILRKEAKTTVLVADGATTVIGGIYTRNTGLNYAKVPFFADLPVIGWFFKTRSESDNRTEVLVFITPKITNRANLRCERPIAPR